MTFAKLSRNERANTSNRSPDSSVESSNVHGEHEQKDSIPGVADTGEVSGLSLDNPTGVLTRRESPTHASTHTDNEYNNKTGRAGSSGGSHWVGTAGISSLSSVTPYATGSVTKSV